jgi:hypothetical protein
LFEFAHGKFNAGLGFACADAEILDDKVNCQAFGVNQVL